MKGKPTKVLISKKALRDAFDICFEMKEFVGNVIAGGDFSKNDQDLHKKAKRFIKAYQKTL